MTLKGISGYRWMDGWMDGWIMSLNVWDKERHTSCVCFTVPKHTTSDHPRDQDSCLTMIPLLTYSVTDSRGCRVSALLALFFSLIASGLLSSSTKFWIQVLGSKALVVVAARLIWTSEVSQCASIGFKHQIPV